MVKITIKFLSQYEKVIALIHYIPREGNLSIFQNLPLKTGFFSVANILTGVTTVLQP